MPPKQNLKPAQKPAEGFNFMKALGFVWLAYAVGSLAHGAKQVYDVDADFYLGEARQWVIPAGQAYFPFSGTLENVKDEQTCWAVTTSTGQEFTIKQDKFSGCGSFGSAYTACAGADCNYIGKLITFSGWMAKFGLDVPNTKANFAREVYMATRAGELGIGPKIHAAYFCSKRRQGMIIMDKVEISDDSCVVSWNNAIMTQLVNKVNTMHLNGILHQDLAERNVLVDAHGMPWIIDYGLALQLGTPMHQALQAYDIASLYYELAAVLLQYQIRQQQNLVGQPIQVVQKNSKMPQSEYPKVPVRWGFSDEIWLEATQLRYDWKAIMPFWQWNNLNLLATTYWYPNAVEYVRLVLLQLSPEWKKYFQKQGVAVLLDAFIYTYGRIGFRQGSQVKQVISQYLKQK